MPSLTRRLKVKLAKWRGQEPPLDLTAGLFPQYEIGRGAYGRPRVFSYPNDGTLKIGAYCSIAADVAIFLGGSITGMGDRLPLRRTLARA